MITTIGHEWHFIFLMDLSGSMRNRNRIGMAKDALEMFVRSLPAGCKFSILSFGTSYLPMIYNWEYDTMENNDLERKDAIRQI